MKLNLVTLKPVEEKDADELFDLIYQSSITNTILWDGPKSLEDLRQGLREREKLFKEGKIHQFTIIENTTKSKIGSVDIRPFESAFRGDMGLWVGEQYQGRGFGTSAVNQILQYAFHNLGMQKVEANIFVGNLASRKVFEKCGFQLEGTVRRCEIKNGKFVDEWLLGILKEEAIS